MGWRSWLGIAAVFAFVLWTISISGDSTSSRDGQSYSAPYESYTSRPTPAVQAQPAFAADPVYFETGEIRYAGFAERLAPLEIVTRAGTNYFVKLVDANTGVAVEFMLIRGGDRLEVLMPLGTYELRYATGETWYGEELLFGPATRYSRADAPFQFRNNGYQYEGYTVELYLQAGGNLDLDSISASQF